MLTPNYSANMPSPDSDCEGADRSTSSEAIEKHEDYYFDFAIFRASDNTIRSSRLTNRHQVENQLFKVPSRNFANESDIFSDMFQLPPIDGTPDGLSDDQPIRLYGIKKSDFIQLLRVMFPL